MKRRMLSPLGQQRARLGRKAIMCGRIQSAADARQQRKAHRPAGRSASRVVGKRGLLQSIMPTRAMLRRVQPYALAVVGVAVLVGAVSGGYTLYAAHRTGVEQAEERTRIDQARVESLKSAACLSDRGSSSQSMTYDELYSTACD